MGRDGVLCRLESPLHRLRPERGRVLLQEWGKFCPLLADAALDLPGDVPGWVWGLGSTEADAVLRALVEMAQTGDHFAAAAVVVCLRPGVLALAGQWGLSVDELVSELAVVVYEFPLTRRRSVAGQLLLDARKQLLKRAAALEIPGGDTRRHLERLTAPGELGAGTRVPERLTELVRDAWKAGHVSADEARLVLLTRVWGEPLSVAARRFGIGYDAVVARRSRAEARIAKRTAR